MHKKVFLSNIATMRERKEEKNVLCNHFNEFNLFVQIFSAEYVICYMLFLFVCVYASEILFAHIRTNVHIFSAINIIVLCCEECIVR